MVVDGWRSTQPVLGVFLMTSNQFTFLVFVLLLGFGGYLSHPIVPPEIGIPLVTLFILGVAVIAIVLMIWAKIEWWWINTDFYLNRKIRKQKTREEERKKIFSEYVNREIERKRRQR